MKNAQRTLRRVMDVILSAVKWQYVSVYFDHIAIFSKSLKDLTKHTRSVVSFLKDACDTLRLQKRTHFTNPIDYLGHAIKPGKLEAATHTVSAIRKLQIPTTVTDLISRLGVSNVFRQFLPSSARISSQLSKRLHKSQAKELASLIEEKLSTLETLKEKLLSPPVLTVPRSNEQCTLEAETYGVQVGWKVPQKQD